MNHFDDFSRDPALLLRLDSSLKRTYGHSTDLSFLATEVVDMVKVQQKEFQNEPTWVTPTGTPPAAIIPESSRFEDFDPREIARQLSLLTLQLLRTVSPVEFFNYQWFKNPNAVPKLKELLLFCVDLSDWVATRILDLKDVKDRVIVRPLFLEFISSRPPHPSSDHQKVP